MSEFLNPFNLPPWPSMIRVGFGEENVLHCEIESTGDVKFYDDPLGPAVLTLKPEDWEVAKFIASHLEHYHTEKPETDIRQTEGERIRLKHLPPKSVAWWSEMHNDALHAGTREDCTHCEEMIRIFGPMPPMAEIEQFLEHHIDPLPHMGLTRKRKIQPQVETQTSLQDWAAK